MIMQDINKETNNRLSLSTLNAALHAFEYLTDDRVGKLSGMEKAVVLDAKDLIEKVKKSPRAYGFELW